MFEHIFEDDPPWYDDAELERLTRDALEGELFDDDDLSTLPEDLDRYRPGLPLMAFLSKVDRANLSGYDVIAVLKARDRLVSHLQAERAADLVEAARRTDGMDPHARVDAYDEFAPAEVAAALRLTRRAADAELQFAWDLCERLPEVGELMSEGQIDQRRARVIFESTSHLPHEAAREVIEQVSRHAGGLTTGQLRARLRRLVLGADPGVARQRYELALEGRRLTTEPGPDGTAGLMGLDLPPDRVSAVYRRIDRIARGLKVGGENRSIDQLRADVFLDLLSGESHPDGGRRAVVDIRVDLATLVGLSDEPGEIPGWGPVLADVCRQAVDRQSGSEWRVRVIDPDHGEEAVIVTRRRPTARQRRHIETRDPHCVFPGCRVPATECDVDHSIQWSRGGETTLVNQAPLCRYHHRVKDQADWSYSREGRRYHWVSRLGHDYLTEPEDPP